MQTYSEHPIVNSIRSINEAFPFPKRPLVSKQRWQEGYLSAAKFGGRLYQDLTGNQAAIGTESELDEPKKVLVLGCGEFLPYVFRNMEPANHQLYCVDISRACLYRAKFRLTAKVAKTHFIHSDICDFLKRADTKFDHIDASNVLHHLVNPTAALRLMSKNLKPNGILKLEINNSRSRSWLADLRRSIELMNMDPFSKEDRNLAKNFVQSFLAIAPHLRERLTIHSRELWSNESQFVNLFFTAHENRLPIEWWHKTFRKAGLRMFSLVDRFGELDHLPNPLWNPPTIAQLKKHVEERSFEGNWEMFFCHSDIASSPYPETKLTNSPIGFSRYILRTPPAKWFEYLETSEISTRSKYMLWYRHLAHTHEVGGGDIKKLAKKFDEQALQRLARVGAILPKQVDNIHLRRSMSRPMRPSPLVAQQVFPADLRDTHLTAKVKKILRKRKIFDDRLYGAIMGRLNRAYNS